jgi:8-oxo-dGTP pyrophosphatase MutT (NUDIX family)
VSNTRKSSAIGTENVVFSGKIFELVQTEQPDDRIFEKARRAPGTRIIIADVKKRRVLLTREQRYELNRAWDYRLPGGKVFDTLSEYAAFRGSGEDILAPATKKIIAEAREEAGVAVKNPILYAKSTLGSTVEWDLYVFVATDFRQVERIGGEHDEEIENDAWLSYAEARDYALNGKMQEERIALVLLRWLKEQDSE